MSLNSLIAQAQAATSELEDQSQVVESQFDNEPPAAGFTPARFVGYVELGKRKQRPYQGKDKPPADEVRLYFELNGPKHQREVEVDGVKQTFTNTISVKIAKKHTDNASFTKLFKKMTYGRSGITHMAQMLGEGFLVQIVHNTQPAADGKPAKTYANMRDDDGNFLIQAPMVVDPITNESRPIPVPEMTAQAKVLLWATPTKEQWDSIFIDGTRTVKDAKGLETQVSKNWLQEDIVQNALNFDGSPLQALLGGLADLSLEADVPAAPETPAQPAPAAPAPSAPATPAPAPAAAPAASAPGADLLADLGLK